MAEFLQQPAFALITYKHRAICSFELPDSVYPPF